MLLKYLIDNSVDDENTRGVYNTVSKFSYETGYKNWTQYNGHSVVQNPVFKLQMQAKNPIKIPCIAELETNRGVTRMQV